MAELAVLYRSGNLARVGSPMTTDA